ncbi:MAG: winged helix-turn-helix domain-containing protein [Reichenbachiella sp.]
MRLKQFKSAYLILACLLLLISNGIAQKPFFEKHIEVSLRMIGHQVLLNTEDSTSHILPILKTNEQYRIQFESEFEFNPDELVNTVNEVMKYAKISTGYIMEVEQCESGDIIYSYEVGDMENIDIIPCQTRVHPKSCYSLLFTLKNLEGLSSVGAINPTDPSQADTHQFYYITSILSLILIAVLSLFLWKRKNKPNLNPNLIPLGKYLFDKLNAELILGEQVIELSSKEADLLLLLHNTVNETVTREVILNVVWGDVGDYVGRTLDVFISKIRKKIEADSSLKIVNIRGVGYKLVVDV